MKNINNNNGNSLYDPRKVKADFPVLDQVVNDYPLVYLDNAASTQKPSAVVDRMRLYYEHEHSNVHRGVHALSQRATESYENARETLKDFINAPDSKQLIFVRGTTEGINLVAATYGRKFVKKDDEILVSAMEHHSNIVPWQMLCEEVGAHLKVIPMTLEGELDLDAYSSMLNPRVRLVAVGHVSNALGTVNPVKHIVEEAHRHDIPVLVDGAQAIPHMAIDVQELDCDFYVFSSHKMYGPTGIGALYGRKELLEKMPPYQGGGDMILSVSFGKTIFNDLPFKFEAGTPNIAGVIGFAAAAEYVSSLGLDHIARHEHELLDYATQKLSQIEGFRIYGTAQNKASVISFLFGDVHPHDIGTILDQEGIAIRTGHHCAQPVMDFFEIPATARASLGIYNTTEDVDRLAEGLQKINEVFA